jgi:hypothetical protein
VPHERPVIRTQSRRKKKTTNVSCLASPIVVPLVGREEWVGNHGVLGTLPEDGIQEDGNEKKKTDTCSCALLCSNQCLTSTDIETRRRRNTTRRGRQDCQKATIRAS